MIKAGCGVIYCTETSRILTVTRRGTDIRSFVGGKLDDGETPEVGIFREVLEETGIDLSKIENRFVDKYIGEDDSGVMVQSNIYFVRHETEPSGDYEKDMNPKWVTIDELFSNMAYGEYNRAVLAHAYIHPKHVL